MSTNLKKRMQSAKEAGLVSIMVTLILMIVISLIVVGFAQISRRNQRQALDRQLSTQAFYAAETGVNDVRDLIEAAAVAGQGVPEKTDCGPGSGATAAFYASLSPELDPNADVEYTCLMVDPTPETLLWSTVDTSSVVVPVISASGSNIASIRLRYNTPDNTTTPTTTCPTTTSGVFSPTGSWTCGYGVVRFDLVPTNGTFNYADLQNRTMTTFLVPQRPGSAGSTNSIGYVTNGSNNRIGVNCSNSNCTMTITGLSVNQYYMRISSTYKESKTMQVNAFDSSGNTLELSGAQAVIDATGKAQDVLRRIQVHVPLTPSSENRMSDYALQSTDAICKRFVVMDNHFDTQVSGVTSTNPLCQP